MRGKIISPFKKINPAALLSGAAFLLNETMNGNTQFVVV